MNNTNRLFSYLYLFVSLVLFTLSVITIVLKIRKYRTQDPSSKTQLITLENMFLIIICILTLSNILSNIRNNNVPISFPPMPIQPFPIQPEYSVDLA